MTFPWLILGAMGTVAAAAGLARLTGRYGLVAVAAAALILWLHGPLYYHYTSDDSYISYRYAHNFAGGLGLVWNPGQWVEGYSNFLWVLLIAGFDKAGADIVTTGRWLGFAFGVTAAGGTYLLARELLEGEAGRVAGFAAALLLALAGPFALWSTAGLEGSLFASLILGAVLLHLRERAAGSVPASGMVWALAGMTRPDALVFVAVSGAFKIADGVTRIRDAGSDEAMRRREELLRIVAWAAGFLALYVPYFAWRWTAYGWLFPNTFYAKVGTDADQFERGLRYLALFAQEYAAWLLLIVPVAIALTCIRRRPAAYVLAMAVAWGAYVVYVGGDSLVRFRFFAPVLPLFYALVVASAGALVQSVRIEPAPPRRAVEAAVALGLAGTAAFTLYASIGGAEHLGIVGERHAVADRVEIGRWLRDNVPDDTVVAVIPAGAIPYESRLPTIDMLGISDEHIAHRDVQLGGLAAGHEKYDSEYVLDQAPDIIILFDGLADEPRMRAGYAVLENVIIPAAVDMVTNERLWREYDTRSVEIREGRWFNLLVRRDASAVLVRTRTSDPARP
ncbi:MAG: hypothetical protein WEC75_01405 [Dehalococcoidia bacterium]